MDQLTHSRLQLGVGLFQRLGPGPDAQVQLLDLVSHGQPHAVRGRLAADLVAAVDLNLVLRAVAGRHALGKSVQLSQGRIGRCIRTPPMMISIKARLAGTR